MAIDIHENKSKSGKRLLIYITNIYTQYFDSYFVLHEYVTALVWWMSVQFKPVVPIISLTKIQIKYSKHVTKGDMHG